MTAADLRALVADMRRVNAVVDAWRVRLAPEEKDANAYQLMCHLPNPGPVIGYALGLLTKAEAEAKRAREAREAAMRGAE